MIEKTYGHDDPCPNSDCVKGNCEMCDPSWAY